MASNCTGSNLSSPEWYIEAAAKAYVICYFFITPFYFLVGIPLHCVCLKAFLAEQNKDKGYLYQVYLMISRLCETFFVTVLVISYYWLAYNASPSTAWFHSCYYCMWFAVKITPFFAALCVTVVMLFSLLLCADRCYALWKPFSYRASYAKRNNRLIACLIVLIAIPINLSQLFTFTVAPVSNDSSQYKLIANDAFKYSLHGQLMYQARSVQEGIGLVLLYVCNTAMIWLFRVRKMEAKKLLNVSNEMKKRNEAERTLTQLAIAQSLCFTASITYKTVHAVRISLDPSYLTSQGKLHQPLLQAVMNLSDLLDFVCVFALSKRFRQSIRKHIPCSSTGSTVTVTPMVPIRAP